MIIDQEFKSLIPPLSSEEFKQLEANCLKEGIRDSIVVWDNNGEWILIDGHNRYEIAQKHGLPYNQKRMTFPSREAVIEWIILNQFGRRNLSAYDRSILALKLKPVIAERAKESQGTRTDICQKSDKSIDTKKELAKVAGVSHDTIHKVETIEKKAPERVKEACRRGEISINKAYSSILASEHDTIKKQQERELREARNRHEAFHEQKSDGVINLEAAKQDKEDYKLLFEDFWNDFHKASMSVYGIVAKVEKDEIRNLLIAASIDDLKELYNTFDRWMLTARQAKRIIEEVKDEKQHY